MRIKRIPNSVTPTSASADDPEVQVNDAGFCWRKIGQRYIGEVFLPNPGCRLIDVPGLPLHGQGDPGCVALCPDGRCWRKNSEGAWVFEKYIVDPEPEDLLVRGLRVDGNFSVPVIEGKIPVYSRGEVLIGHIEFTPIEPE